ncbi:cell surface A33 antigen-like [Oreochromis niloticus]|uniref:Glycoprotein A33 (transmembrane), paralog a n=1 Tax=Oreochromis niloticus TaxID=8128 RepID=A0A669EQD2_ORENI|nr:cell surface A33 antigen-like [Oreochromis niloticus]
MEKKNFSLTLLCLMLSGVGAVTVTIPQGQYEYARGDNITLPCSFRTIVSITSQTQVVITWSSLTQQTTIDETVIATYYHSSTPTTDIDTDYEGRVSVDVDVTQGKANLKLFSISLADNKNFECRVQIPGDRSGKQTAITNLVVLVAPSTPVCKIQGTAQYGQDITLTCASAEGSPNPTYSWKRFNVQNQSVPQDSRTTDKDGILSLYNITKDTSGYYVCTSQNKIRSATCNLTLSVMPPSMNIASTAGIIGGVAAVLVILIIVICCCCCRKKNKDEEYAMGVREGDEYHDNEPDRNGEGQRVEGQGKDSYEDSSVKKTERNEEKSQPDRRDYDDRRSDYDDRRSDYNDRRRDDYDDRRSDYDDRRSDYDDRRRDYDDRRRDYDDRRSDYSDRRERYDDDRRHQDRRRDDDRYDDRDRDRPPVPNSKPPRRDYDD